MALVMDLCSIGAGYFMHFSTISGTQGDTALLESMLLYPNRNYQCLQFFYYHTGNLNDKLEIGVREYSEANPSGTLHMIETITGETSLHMPACIQAPLTDAATAKDDNI